MNRQNLLTFLSQYVTYDAFIAANYRNIVYEFLNCTHIPDERVFEIIANLINDKKQLIKFLAEALDKKSTPLVLKGKMEDRNE